MTGFNAQKTNVSQKWICFTEVHIIIIHLIKALPSLSVVVAPAEGTPCSWGRSCLLPPNSCLLPHLPVCPPPSFTSFPHSPFSIQGSVSHYKLHIAVFRPPPISCCWHNNGQLFSFNDGSFISTKVKILLTPLCSSSALILTHGSVIVSSLCSTSCIM